MTLHSHDSSLEFLCTLIGITIYDVLSLQEPGSSLVALISAVRLKSALRDKLDVVFNICIDLVDW